MSIFTQNMLVRTKHSDVNGELILSALLEALQETAGDHLSSLQCGILELRKQGLCWVLLRTDAEMNRYPAIGETLTLSTVTQKPRHGFYPRLTLLKDENENEIGRVSSLWTVMDLETRKAVSVREIEEKIPRESGITVPMVLPSPVKLLDGERVKIHYRVQYTDLDVNGHVNNCRYADWLCNILGRDVLTRCFIRTLSLQYSSEIPPEEEIELTVSQNGLMYILSGTKEDKTYFSVSCTMEERK